jgi:hypothetical protein
MKGLNYLVLIFFGFILLANLFWLIQLIYYIIIGKATFNKKMFTWKRINSYWKK